MKRFVYAAVIALVCVSALPVGSEAAVLRTGEDVIVTNEQQVSDDFYALGTSVTSSGNIQGDFYAMAESFTNNGEIDGDAVVVGNTIDLHASITDDVRVAGNTVTVAGPVGGDLIVFATSLDVLSTASIGGDILFYGGDAKILGDVAGSVLGGGDSFRIDAVVGESVDVDTQTLTLGDKAEIYGDVTYVSPQEIVRSQNATVVGEIVRGSEPPVPAPSFENTLLSFVIILFTALVLQLVLRPQLTHVIQRAHQQPGMSGLVGLSAFVLLPIILVLALASMLGLMLGLMLLFMLLLSLLLAAAFAPVVLGTVVSRLVQDSIEPNVLYTILGAGIVQALLFVPVVGLPLLFILFVLTFGALLLSGYRTLRA